MDLSSLPEAQQQQLQQLQLQFQEHQAQQAQAQAQAQAQQQAQQQQQQQQQYQDYASQAYDPSQAQAYAQSTQAYYSSYYPYQQPQQSQYPQQNQPPQNDHQQQQHAYHQPDYANANQQPQHSQSSQHEPAVYQLPSQLESVTVQPPGIHNSHEGASHMIDGSVGGSGQGQVAMQHQHNAYYPPGIGEQQHQQPPQQGLSSSSYPIPSGLNAAAAAAVAALSQLTQFAGSMDAAERAMAGLQERQWHAKGGGYGPMMGPGPYHGLGPMHHGPGPMRQLDNRSPHRGGGRRGGSGPIRGGGRGKFDNRNSRSGSSFRGRGRGRGGGGPSHGSSSTSSLPEPSNTKDPDSTQEQAEQPSGTVNEEAAQVEKPAPNRRPPQAAWCDLCKVDCTSFEILEQHKNGKKHKKNLQKAGELKNGNETVSETQKEENNDKATEENLVPSEESNKPEPEQASENPRTENKFDNYRGTKRKMRGGGRGGKRVRTFEPSRPKVVIPLMCDLCNVKCDTREVFERHLAGKKHMSKLKRFEGHQAMYGPMVQALYPPNPIAQGYFGHQQGYYGPPPQGGYMAPPQAHQGVGYNAQFQQNSNPLGSEAQVGDNGNVDNTASVVEYGFGGDNVVPPGLDVQAKPE